MLIAMPVYTHTLKRKLTPPSGEVYIKRSPCDGLKRTPTIWCSTTAAAILQPITARAMYVNRFRSSRKCSPNGIFACRCIVVLCQWLFLVFALLIFGAAVHSFTQFPH